MEPVLFPRENGSLRGDAFVWVGRVEGCVRHPGSCSPAVREHVYGVYHVMGRCGGIALNSREHNNVHC